jgi:hypothetical protein
MKALPSDGNLLGDEETEVAREIVVMVLFRLSSYKLTIMYFPFAPKLRQRVRLSSLIKIFG